MNDFLLLDKYLELQREIETQKIAIKAISIYVEALEKRITKLEAKNNKVPLTQKKE
mgnify:CR=1 FL=1